MTRIMAVDDDPDVLGSLGRVLDFEGYEKRLASSGPEALRIISEFNPEMLILDIIMPGMDGIDVCRALRSDPNFVALPILFLTAKHTTNDVVDGLDAGADDYIIKPFEVSELTARIKALLRRGQRAESKEENDNVLEIDGLKLDIGRYRVFVDENPVSLTVTEYRLLRYCMENKGKTLPLDELLQSVWDYPEDTGDPDLVRAHVRNLRKKLDKSDNQRFIHTIHSVGYRIP